MHLGASSFSTLRGQCEDKGTGGQRHIHHSDLGCQLSIDLSIGDTPASPKVEGPEMKPQDII